MIKNTTAKIILLLIAAAFALPANAQLKGKTEVSLQAGAMNYEGDTDLKTDWLFGARLGHYFTDAISAEVAFIGGKTKVKDTGDKLKVFYPSANLAYNFVFGKFVPFVKAGAGAYIMDPENGSSETDFGVNYGVGLKYFFTQNLAFRAEADHFIDTESGTGTHNLQALAGLSFFFGNCKKAEAVKRAGEEKKAAVETVAAVAPVAEETPVAAPVEQQEVVLAPVPQPVKEEVVLTKDKNLVLHGVTFANGSASITPESEKILNEVYAALVAASDFSVEIQGHTDSTSSDAFNLKLSQKRANAVKDYLVKKGIAENRLAAKGYGETQPIADNTTKDGRAANRRIEFKVLN